MCTKAPRFNVTQAGYTAYSRVCENIETLIKVYVYTLLRLYKVGRWYFNSHKANENVYFPNGVDKVLMLILIHVCQVP